MDKQDVYRIKDILWRWGRCDKRITELIEQMQLAQARMNDMYVIGSSPRMDGMPHGTSKSDPVMREFERIQEAQKRFRQEREQCGKELLEQQKFKADVTGCVLLLPGLEQDILRMKYHGRYRGKSTMVYIASMCGVSERTVYNRETSAIKALGEMEPLKKLIAAAH